MAIYALVEFGKMRKILDQREDAVIAELREMQKLMPNAPERVPRFLYATSAALGSKNPRIAEEALVTAQFAARQNFAIAWRHFARQGDFETVLGIAQYARDCDCSPALIYLARQAYDKPERFCYIALKIAHMYIRRDSELLGNEKVLIPLLRMCERAFLFPRNIETAMSVLVFVAERGLLPAELQGKVELIARASQGRTQTAAYEVLGMASMDPSYVRGVRQERVLASSSNTLSNRYRSFRRESVSQDDVEVVRKLDSGCDSPDLDARPMPLPTHNWSPERGLERGSRQASRGRSHITNSYQTVTGSEVIELPQNSSPLEKFNITDFSGSISDLDRVNTQIRNIFGNEHDILTKESKFDLLHFLKRTEPCLSLIDFGLRVRLVNFLLLYLLDNKEIVTPWLRDLPHCKVHLQDRQFEQLKACVQSAMITQHKCYPELETVYKQMKDQVLQYGFEEK